jgi:polyhydroxyalkanoate synthesis repressor PhaR
MTILIKKYKNRRLYDTDKSQYITVDKLQNYIMAGVAFKVEDSSTGRDLTNATLLQLLVEIESGPTQFLSTEMLTQLIKLSNHPMHINMKSTLEKFFSTLENTLQDSPYQLVNENWNQVLESWKKILKP